MKTDIRQHDISDCGVAAIASIARYYGQDIPLTAIREASGTSQAGTTLKGLTDACRALGFSAHCYKSEKTDAGRLRDVPVPVILHTVNSHRELHFVVLYSLGRRKATIMDPSVGRHIHISHAKLQQEWTGYIVTMRPDSSTLYSSHRSPDPSVTYTAILASTKRDFCMSLLCSATYVAAGVCSTLFLQHIIDDVIPSGDLRMLAATGGLLALLTILTLAVGYARTMAMLRCCVRIDGKLIINYLRRLFRLPTGFFARRGSGELNSRISDAMKVRHLLTEGLDGILTGGMMLIFSFCLMFSFHRRLALLTMAFIPLYSGLYLLARRANRRWNRRIIESAARFEEKCVEGISSIRAIKYFGSGEDGQRDIERSYVQLSTNMLGGGRCIGRFTVASEALTKLSVFTVLTAGSVFVLKGHLSIGELVSFYAMCSLFAAPLSRLTGISEMVSEAGIAMERLQDITELKPEDEGGLEVRADKAAPIIFRDATFAYPGGMNVFEHLDYTFRPGRITAIRGESGCGKSSLAALMMRDYDLNHGKILLEETDIRLFDVNSWRRYVTIVPQEAVLRDASLLDNVTGGESCPDYERAAALLGELGMKEFITSLPMGILTRIGERGCCVSGGQRQRIALARALYRNPQVLILDEATSSLDSESQRYILDKLKSLRDEGRTVIMITHRDDNAAIADEILEMHARTKGHIPDAPARSGDNN